MVTKNNELAIFINCAHLATYATGVKPNIDSVGNKTFYYHEGEQEYLDQYQDDKNFIGFEIVKKEKKPIWGMNYYGQVTDEKIDTALVNSFLRQMLMKNKPGMLLRGPKGFKKKSWHYRYVYRGSLNNFQAHEIIKYQGKIVYTCYLNGGRL